MIRACLVFLVLVLALPARAATDVETLTTPGGIDAWMVRDASIPVVTINLHIRGGAALDPVGKEGVTDFMVALMGEGAGDLDATAYAERREELPMRFSISAGRGGVSLSATILKRDLDACVGFLALTLSQPRFSEAAIARVRPQLISSLRSEVTDPDAIAGIAFRRALFGDHLYGRQVQGSLETVPALTRDDILAAHRSSFRRDDIAAAVVGDISAERAAALLDRLVAVLPEGAATMPQPAPLDSAGGLTVIDHDSSQSTAYFGHRGLSREDPDYLAAYIANFVLGGWSAKARLGQELRQERGLTYGVNTFMRSDPLGPLVLGSVSTPNDRMAEAVEVIRAEWTAMAERGVTADELEAARRYLIGSYPLGFDTNGKIAGALVGLQRAELPPDYIRTRNEQIAALTLEDVNRAARRLFQPGKLRIIVVGKPEGLATAD